MPGAAGGARRPPQGLELQERARRPGGTKLAAGSVDALLQACDLLSQFVYLLFEVFLPPTYAGIPGFEDEAESVYGSDSGSPHEAGRAAEAAQGRLAGRASRGRGGEKADGEAGRGPEGRPEKKLRRTFAHSKSTPPGACLDRASVA